MIAVFDRSLRSGKRARRNVPMRHGLQAMNVDGESGAYLMRWNEEVPDCREDRYEALQASYRPKSLQHSLPLSQWQVRIFRPVVETFVRSMLDFRHDLALCCAVRVQFVGDDTIRRETFF